MSEPLALSLGQKFELERMNRAIDATGDPQALRGLAKQLLQAWQSQKAATQWVMRQQLGSSSQVVRELGLDPQALEARIPASTADAGCPPAAAKESPAPQSPTGGTSSPFHGFDVL